MERYRLYTEIQWPSGTFPRLWLTVYIAVLAACIPLLALFLTFATLKTGNLAGDNEQLAALTRRTIEMIQGGSGTAGATQRSRLGRFAQIMAAFTLCHFSVSTVPLAENCVGAQCTNTSKYSHSVGPAPSVCPANYALSTLSIRIHQLRYCIFLIRL